MMPDALPTCFRERGSHLSPAVTNQSASSTKSAQNLVTCLYRTTINGDSHIVSVTWCKSLMGQGLSVSFGYPACSHRCSVDMKPWLFWKRQGSKSFVTGEGKIEMFWDLSSAKYGCGSEPLEGFFVVVACNNEAVLLLGDMRKEALRKVHAQQEPPADATLLSRKEHVYGKQHYTTKAQLCERGRRHDIAIECHVAAEKKDASRLSVRVDKQIVIHVTSLMWKFRGNQTIQIDGVAVNVFWDVHNWLFKAEEGHAVFMFNTRAAAGKPRTCIDAGFSSTWPASANKPQCVSDGLWASVLQWPTSSTVQPQEEQSFSLLLYAWNNEKPLFSAIFLHPFFDYFAAAL